MIFQTFVRVFGLVHDGRVDNRRASGEICLNIHGIVCLVTRLIFY